MLPNLEATRRIWLWGAYNVPSATEELSFYFCGILINWNVSSRLWPTYRTAQGQGILQPGNETSSNPGFIAEAFKTPVSFFKMWSQQQQHHLGAVGADTESQAPPGSSKAT